MTRVVRLFGMRIRANNLLLSPVGSGTASIDLSRATRLEGVAFRYNGSKDLNWVIRTLRTITPEHRHLRQISIYVPSRLTSFDVGANIGQTIGGTITRQWLDLDHLLVQFWESRLIRPRVECVRLGQRRQSAEYCVGGLLPETTKRGIIDLVEYRKCHWM